VLALHPRVVDAVYTCLQAHLPPRPPDTHPLGCHRQRISDRDCFTGILQRLVTGCSWDVAARLSIPSETTLRDRRTEWLNAGVFEAMIEEALAAYDRIIGLDLSEVAIDGSLHKAPCGGEATGPNPTDRGKTGWKWSVCTDRWGIPIGWVAAGANRNDSMLLEPTLEAVASRGLLADIDTLHLDKGYAGTPTLTTCADRGLTDVICPKKQKPSPARTKKYRNASTKAPLTLGARWPVERTNSWLSNYGQMRRNTDRYIDQRLGQLSLTITLILTIKLIKWADRWNQ